MKLRTLALALALGCGFTTVGLEAKAKTLHRVAPKRKNSKAYKAYRASKSKAPKVKRVKTRRR